MSPTKGRTLSCLKWATIIKYLYFLVAFTLMALLKTTKMLSLSQPNCSGLSHQTTCVAHVACDPHRPASSHNRGDAGRLPDVDQNLKV